MASPTSNKVIITLVDGASRIPLDFERFNGEPRQIPPPTEAIEIAGVILSALQYSALADPRFAALARHIASMGISMHMERDGILWLPHPLGLKGIELRWTPDEPGWKIIKYVIREFSAPDFLSAIEVAKREASKHETFEEMLLGSLGLRPEVKG